MTAPAAACPPQPPALFEQASRVHNEATALLQSTRSGGGNSSGGPHSGAAADGASAAPPDNVLQLFQRAEELYRRVLVHEPRNAQAHHHLGALLAQAYPRDKERCEEAHRLITTAVNLQPACAKTRNSLGVVCQCLERWNEAVDAFERANEKDPLNVGVLMNLARALREVGRSQRAAEVYGTISKLQPNHPTAHFRRGALLRSLRRNEEALVAFRNHLRLHPEHKASQFWVAALTGDAEAMAAAPPEMVAGLFDSYADHFDDHLVNKLQYRTPEALHEQLLASCSTSTSQRGSGGTGVRWRRCLDAGCGTGLMGPLLAPHCDAVEGVDLSAGMVDAAAKRGCYSRLVVGELVAFLDKEAAAVVASTDVQPYDLIVAADVFVYIGDMAPAMRAAAAASTPDAVLAFSTEALERAVASKDGKHLRADGDAAARGLRLMVTGRYAHSAEYLAATGESCGWRVVSTRESIIRFNGGEPIHGHLVVMRKK